MLNLFKAFLEIALWRKGPQHLPASGLLLLITVAIYCVLAWVLAGVAEPPEDRLGLRTALELGLVLGWVWLVLAIFRRPARFVQTATAIIGTTALIMPLVIGLDVVMRALGQAHVLRVPVGLAMLTAFVWYVLITAHIWRSALEVSLFAAIVLALLYLACEYVVTTRMLALTTQG